MSPSKKCVCERTWYAKRYQAVGTAGLQKNPEDGLIWQAYKCPTSTGFHLRRGLPPEERRNITLTEREVDTIIEALLYLDVSTTETLRERLEKVYGSTEKESEALTQS